MSAYFDEMVAEIQRQRWCAPCSPAAQKRFAELSFHDAILRRDGKSLEALKLCIARNIRSVDEPLPPTELHRFAHYPPSVVVAGNTPLMTAVAFGAMELVGVLRTAGASFTAVCREDRHNSVLHYAALHRRGTIWGYVLPLMPRRFLQHRNDDGDAALHIAVRLGQFSMALQLILRVVELHKQDTFVYEKLMESGEDAQEPSDSVIREIVLLSTASTGDTVLHLAARYNGRKELLPPPPEADEIAEHALLYDEQPDPPPDPEGISCTEFLDRIFDVAATHRFAHELLLAQNNRGETALFTCSTPEMFTYLQDKTDKTLGTDHSTTLALTGAATIVLDASEVLTVLGDVGPKRRCLPHNSLNQSPLHLLCQSTEGNGEMVRPWLDVVYSMSQCSVNLSESFAPDCNGASALDVFDGEVFRPDSSARGDNPLLMAIRSGNNDAAIAILSLREKLTRQAPARGEQMNSSQRSEGNDSLRSFVDSEEGAAKDREWIAQRLKPLFIVDSASNTALHVAAYHRRGPIIEHLFRCLVQPLLNAVEPPDVPVGETTTAAQYHSRMQPFFDVLWMVCEPIKQKNSDGFTPVMLAAQCNDGNTMDALIKGFDVIEEKLNLGAFMCREKYIAKQMMLRRQQDDTVVREDAKAKTTRKKSSSPMLSAATMSPLRATHGTNSSFSMSEGLDGSLSISPGACDPSDPSFAIGFSTSLRAILCPYFQQLCIDRVGGNIASLTASMLLEGHPVRSKTTPLHLACASNSPATVSAMMRRLAAEDVVYQIYRSDSPSGTPQYTLLPGPLSTLLLQRDNDGETPLCSAIGTGNLETVIVLLTNCVSLRQLHEMISSSCSRGNRRSQTLRDLAIQYCRSNPCRVQPASSRGPLPSAPEDAYAQSKSRPSAGHLPRGVAYADPSAVLSMLQPCCTDTGELCRSAGLLSAVRRYYLHAAAAVEKEDADAERERQNQIEAERAQQQEEAQLKRKPSSFRKPSLPTR